ncbi:MAG: LytTR family DNA-binding domain-containing protein [Clostridiales bacterium]|nr:LytTR family DNA-binding domain-containing protein [Clostridiales bacterium]
MLGIVISDDDKFIRDLSADIIKECIKTCKFDAEIVLSAADYNEISVFLNRSKTAYLYFLDIDFGGGKLNGVDIAHKIRQIQPLSKIVFVTSHSELAIKVLKSGAEPFGFIEKRFNRADMAADYKKYIELALKTTSLGQGNAASAGFIKIPAGIDEYIDLDISRILYVEAVKTISHFVCYHSVDGSQISVRDTIENVLKTLGGDFMKSHRAVIINTAYVVAVSDSLVKFSNGETAACSYRLKNEVIKRCLK